MACQRPNFTYNIGRNTFRYPAAWKADLRLAKRFYLGETRELELLAESFNLFNHQNVTEIETNGYSIERAPARSARRTSPTLNFLTGLKPNPYHSPSVSRSTSTAPTSTASASFSSACA